MYSFEKAQSRYRQAIRKALDWLVLCESPDSSFGLKEEDGVGPIFVTPLTYLWGGLPQRCLGVIERMRSKYVQADGSLYRPALTKKLTDQRQRPYALSWVIRSAAACGALDIAHSCVRQVMAFQHPGSGGLFGIRQEADRSEGIIDLASTGMGGLAMLATGKVDQASRVGEYLSTWLERQNNGETRLLCQWHTNLGLLDEASGGDLPANINAPLVIGLHKPHTGYWMCGILLAFLSELYLVTGQESFLTTAEAVFDFAERSDELARVCAAHKFAWGASRLFAATGAIRHLEAACRVADRLCDAQRPAGYFVYEGVFSDEAEMSQADKVSVTSQFAAWIAAVLMHMPRQELTAANPDRSR